MIRGRRDAERDLMRILHPHHRRPHLEVMVKSGRLSEALGARRIRLSHQ
jgi:hypothetical protein